MRQPLFVAATEMIPSPRMLSVRTSKVPLLEEYVFPTAYAPPESFVCAAVVGPEIVIVPPAAAVACERVMLFDPTNTRRVPVIPVSPAVFPPVETPALNKLWVWTVWLLTENWNCCPVVERMVRAPRALNVTDPDVYVVSEFARPEMPVCAPPTFGPLIVNAFPAWLTVMLFPPAMVIVPDEIPASAPDVLPDRVTATMFWVWTRLGGVDHDPLVRRTT